MRTIVTAILLLLGASSYAQLPEYWYHVTTGVENWWPAENSIFFSKKEGSDTVYLSGFTRMDAYVWGTLKNHELTIPKQTAIIEPKGGDGRIAYKVVAEAHGTLTDSNLILGFYFKPDTLPAVTGEIKAIRWSRMDQWRKYPAIDHSDDTIIGNIAYYWKKYDLNGRPIEVGQTNDNNIKNGRWFFWDNQGKLLNEYQYINDTLHGTAIEYLHASGYKGEKTTKSTGLYLSGKKVGRWTYQTKTGRRKWVTEAYYDYDLEGNLATKIIKNNNGGELYMYYSRTGEMLWYCFYDSDGRVLEEGNKMREVTLLE